MTMTPACAHPCRWSVDDVVDWARSVKLSEATTAILRENEVDGSTLVTLSREELQSELGIRSLPARRYLYDLIEKLQAQQASADYLTAVDLYGAEIESLKRDHAPIMNDGLLESLTNEAEIQRQIVSDHLLALQSQQEVDNGAIPASEEMFEDRELARDEQRRLDELALVSELDHRLVADMSSREEQSQQEEIVQQQQDPQNEVRSLFALAIDACAANRINVAEAIQGAQDRIFLEDTGKYQPYQDAMTDDEGSSGGDNNSFARNGHHIGHQSTECGEDIKAVWYDGGPLYAFLERQNIAALEPVVESNSASESSDDITAAGDSIADTTYRGHDAPMVDKGGDVAKPSETPRLICIDDDDRGEPQLVFFNKSIEELCSTSGSDEEYGDNADLAIGKSEEHYDPSKIQIQDLPKLKQCFVCYEENVRGVVFACDHSSCVNCLRSLFQAVLRDSSLLPIRCCEVPVDTSLAYTLLKTKEADLLTTRLLEYEAKRKMYCPSCAEFINLDTIDPDVIAEFECDCGEALCAACATQAHPDISCRENKVRQADGDRAILDMAQTQGWKQCPACDAVIEHAQGCNHMTCRCGDEFCFVCLVPWDAEAGLCSTGCELWDEERLLEAADNRVGHIVGNRAVGDPERLELLEREIHALRNHEICAHVWSRQGFYGSCERCQYPLSFYGMRCGGVCRAMVCYTCAHHRIPQRGWR